MRSITASSSSATPSPVLAEMCRISLGGDAEHVLDLLGALLRLGRGQVDLVERGDDREVVLHRLVAVRERLRLDALRRVDEQDHALARGEAAAHLVAEVDVAGRVDQVDDVAVPLQADVLGLDRDAPFALDVHRVEVLGAHVARVDGAGQLEQPIGEGRLPVVDVGDDREGADAVERGGQGDHSRECGAAASLSRFSGQLKRSSRPMANIKSQKKRNLQNETRRVRNKGVRSELKTRVKVAQDGVAARCRRRRRAGAHRAEAARQGRRQGHHPQEPGRSPHLAPDAAHQVRSLSSRVLSPAQRRARARLAG